MTVSCGCGFERSKFMRTECLNSRYVFDMALPVSRLVTSIGDSILFAMTVMYVCVWGVCVCMGCRSACECVLVCVSVYLC